MQHLRPPASFAQIRTKAQILHESGTNFKRTFTQQVHTPPELPSDEQLALVHDPEYLRAFSSCSLDEARVRRCVALQGRH